MVVRKEIIDGEECFHIRDEDRDIYMCNFSYSLSCTSRGLLVTVEFDAWGRGTLSISLWVGSVRSSYTDVNFGACYVPPKIYYAKLGVTSERQRYRITSQDYLRCGDKVVVAAWDSGAGWFVPVTSWSGFWIFQLRPVKSVTTSTGFSITYEIYNYSKRKCVLPVEVRDDSGNVLYTDLVKFSDGTLKVTKTYGSNTRVKALAYKPSCKYVYDNDTYYTYFEDPSTIAAELAGVQPEISITPDRETITASPREDVYIKYSITNNSQYNTEVTIDLTVNGTEVNVPKTMSIPAGGSTTVQWVLHFPDYGSYEVCPKILGVKLV